MKIDLSKYIRIVLCLITTSLANFVSNASADMGSANHSGRLTSQSGYDFDFPEACPAPQEMFEDEQCGWATHDSCPFPITNQASRTSSTFDQSIAAVATTAGAATGISVEQLVEPFAMVGPKVINSLDNVIAFQAWFREKTKTLDLPTPAEIAEKARIQIVAVFDEEFVVVTEPSPVIAGDVESVDEPSVSEEIAMLAAEEPIDVETLGPSVVVIIDPLPSAAAAPEISPSSADQLPPAADMVGASPVIVTLEDEYLPYDLSARDMKVWSVLPSDTDPFCIHSHSDIPSPMWHQLDLEEPAITDAANNSDVEEVATVTDDSDAVTSVEAEPSVTEVVIEDTIEDKVADTSDQTDEIAVISATLQCSPHCLLDELVWHLEVTVNEFVAQHPIGDVSVAGRTIADLFVKSNEVTQNAAARVAKNWPDTSDIEENESDVGSLLLARAGASPEESEEKVIEESELAEEANAQIAEQPSIDATETILR